MFKLFRPLFRYRKYQLAGRLLEMCSNATIIATYTGSNPSEEPNMHVKHFALIRLRDFINKNPKTNLDWLLEAADLLQENEHVIKEDNQDWYNIAVRCTLKGERANNDGAYQHEVVVRRWKLIAAIFGVIGTVILGIIKWKDILTQLGKLF